MDRMSYESGVHGAIFSFSKSYKKAEGSSGEQEPVVIPMSNRTITFTLTPASESTAKLQSTTDSDDDIMAGTAEWVDYGSGASATTIRGSVISVSAVRVVVSAGEAKLSMRG